ncbi:MAG: polymer-forming cytoskeletal protein, partial [Oscillospiraceae bacterium]
VQTPTSPAIKPEMGNISPATNPTPVNPTATNPAPANPTQANPMIHSPIAANQTPKSPMATNPTPTNPMANNPNINNQPKPSFTPMNNPQKPIVSNPNQNNFNPNRTVSNNANFDKPISPRPEFKPSSNMDIPLQPKPSFMPKPEVEEAVSEPIIEKPVVDAQTDRDDFINTFLKARGSDISVAEEKSKDIKANMEKVIFHPDVIEDISTEITMITKGTEIVGKISSTNGIVIGGAIKGDVDSTHNITISGRVEGKVKCKTADLSDCDVIGDVTATEHVRITEKTKIDGNIKTCSIEIDGKVKGNIISTTSVHIMRNALVIGDIITSKLSIEEGAMVQGNISMKIN